MPKRYLFLIFAGLIFTMLACFIIWVGKRKSKNYKIILVAMICGLLEIPIYCITLITLRYMVTYVCTTLILISTEILTYLFFKFTLSYSDAPKIIYKAVNIFGILSIIDLIILVVNIFTGFIFDITFAVNPRGIYWKVNYSPWSTYHFFLCYVYISGCLGNLFYSAKKAPSFYKMRYLGIFFVYLTVIIVHLVCRFMALPVDISLMLYGGMGAFVSIYTEYTAPNQLIYQVLRFYNETADDAHIYLDERGKCLLINKKAKNIFNKNGKFSPEAVEEYAANIIIRHVKNRREKTEFTDSIIVNGEVRDFYGEYVEFYDRKNLLGTFIYLQDRTEENERLKKQRYLANNDPLTGIYNRDYFFREVDNILQRDPFTPRIMICSNIVDFKLVNEILGTEFGDAIIKKQAELIKRLSRADDLYARISDDKFAVLMRKNLFDKDVFLEGLKAVKRLTESEFFQLKVEMGIYEINGDTESAQVIYDKAFMAISKKKENTNQIFNYYDEAFVEAEYIERELISCFDDSLLNNEFKLLFTPVMDEEGNIVAAEADSKWIRDDNTELTSDVYNPVFEKYSVAYRLDKYVWENAIKHLAQLNNNGYEDFELMIQVSFKDSYFMDIYETLVNIVKKYRCNPKNVIIEFFEKSITLDFRISNELFRKLQDFGFRILITNFGHGQTSLNVLKDAHLNNVKIDSSFLLMNESKKTRDILKFMIELANTLELETCISGVTTQEQMEELKKQQIKKFQGPVCGRPAFPDDFERKYLK